MLVVNVEVLPQMFGPLGICPPSPTPPHLVVQNRGRSEKAYIYAII